MQLKPASSDTLSKSADGRRTVTGRIYTVRRLPHDAPERSFKSRLVYLAWLVRLALFWTSLGLVPAAVSRSHPKSSSFEYEPAGPG